MRQEQQPPRLTRVIGGANCTVGQMIGFRRLRRPGVAEAGRDRLRHHDESIVWRLGGAGIQPADVFFSLVLESGTARLLDLFVRRHGGRYRIAKSGACAGSLVVIDAALS
jgi:hypothetical protein